MVKVCFFTLVRLGKAYKGFVCCLDAVQRSLLGFTFSLPFPYLLRVRFWAFSFFSAYHDKS